MKMRLFHLPYLNCKRMLNNYKTTWVCFGCKDKTCSLTTCKSESVEENNQKANTDLGLLLDADDTDDIILTNVKTGILQTTKRQN